MSDHSNQSTPVNSHNKTLHHIATGIGLLFLLGYYLLMDKTGFYDWVTALLPQEYAGSGLMLGIIIAMTPGFFIWKHYNRWIEKKLGVTGKYYEDGFYKAPENKKNTDKTNTPD
nr:hypothetical protein [uncultured Amphritea sp.]